VYDILKVRVSKAQSQKLGFAGNIADVCIRYTECCWNGQ
jgi:hypothetical protein